MKTNLRRIGQRWWRGVLCLVGVFLAVYGLSLPMRGLELLAERLDWSLEGSTAFSAFEFVYYVIAAPLLVFMFVPRLAADPAKPFEDSAAATPPKNETHAA